MNNKESIMGSGYQDDFLWFSYFGITKSDAISDENAALQKCIGQAYLDLSRRLAYKYSVSDLDNMKSKASKDIDGQKEKAKSFIKSKETFIEACENYLFDKINDLLEKESKNYDDWHKETCDNFFCNIDQQELFDKDKRGVLPNIGIAQKWINMTIKYMLVMGLWDKKLNNYKKKLHVPLDSYIYHTMDKYGMQKPDNEWSKLDKYDEYFNAQKSIREKCECPIEWEGQAWIEQAKKWKGEH